jgi:predicted DNA-binding ribbon-helix-helix protein
MVRPVGHLRLRDDVLIAGRGARSLFVQDVKCAVPGIVTSVTSASQPRGMSCTLVKRSMKIGEKRTSVALESEFWAVLEALARGRGQSLPKLIALILSANAERPAASALRVHALKSAASLVSGR